MRRWISLFALFVFALVGSACVTPPRQNFSADDIVKDQLIIGWVKPVPVVLPIPRTPPAPGTALQNVLDLLDRHGFKPIKVLMDGRAWVVESHRGLTAGQLERKAEEIEVEVLVRYVSPNNLVRFRQSSTPPVNDPYYANDQTNLSKIEIEGAWKITTGSKSIKVAVVDTGAQVSHTDLAGNVWNNPCEDLNGQDDVCDSAPQGNGLVDDVHGWNFDTNNADLTDNASHGTAVAGAIAAIRNNHFGIAGIGALSLGILKTTIGTVSDVGIVIAAFDYARHNDFPIATASFTTDFNYGLKQSMELAGDAGMIVVAAAGDDDKDLDIGSQNAYPASFDFDWVISVAASTASDQLKNGSNHGSSVVEIAAPGVDIWSTFPGNLIQKQGGSSMAVPHVAGVVGLILSIRRDASVADVRSCLAKGDPALGSATVWGVRLNARKALEECRPGNILVPMQPGRPTILTTFRRWCPWSN